MITFEKNWYAVYTKSRAEKKVKIELDFQEIENYLPLQRKLRTWSDRKKWVEVPLISGYIFVRIDLKQHEKVLKTDGVVTYVRFEGRPAIIRESQIDLIKRLMQHYDVEVATNTEPFKIGDAVQIIGGPMLGTQGKLVKIKNAKKVIIQLEDIELAFILEVPMEDLAPNVV